MQTKIINKSKYFLILFISFLFFSCHESGSQSPIPSQGSYPLIPLKKVANGKDEELKKLLNQVRGSVGKRGPGSKAIWSTKNQYKLGLYVSANHVIGIDSWQQREEAFIHPDNTGIFVSSQIPKATGELSLSSKWQADFLFYHPSISLNASNTSIQPKEDFYIGIIDNQTAEDNGLGIYPEAVDTSTPLEFYDPYKRAEQEKTWANPSVGKKVIAIGYPQDTENYPNGGLVYGKVLSNQEAEEKIKTLKTLGDEEGQIPYNADVEFFIEGQGVPGMSGGGVFNQKGQYLGVMVRGSTTEKTSPILRVVRISYIRMSMMNHFLSLSSGEQERIRPFIDGEL